MNKVTIELTQEQLDHIKKSGILDTKPSTSWLVPEDGQEFFYLGKTSVCKDVWRGLDVDHELAAHKQIFLTKEEAEAELERRRAIVRIKKYIAENFDPFTPDWSDEFQEKHTIYFDHERQEFTNVQAFPRIRGEEVLLYLASKYHADQVIRDCKDDLKIVFGV